MHPLHRLLVLVGLLLLGLVSAGTATAGEESEVYVLTLDGVINPAAAGYVQRGVQEAGGAGASAIVLRLDTPGGLDGAMREIVQAIDNSDVPVITYVSPEGARAASAGTFIGMASHVLAMAPGTTLGSATPISMGNGGQPQELPEDLRRKVVNDAASYIRAHAEFHGRNAEWAEKAVREGANLTATEATEENVADLVAGDLQDLLRQVDGLEVRMALERRSTLRTEGAATRPLDMTFVERFLHTISNPNLAFILMSVAMLGIFFELANPGTIVPGVVGGISLLMSLYSLGTLNAFWGGMLLVVLAFGLFIAEVFTTTNGILGIGGVIALVIGGMLLFATGPPGVEVSPWVIGATGGVAVALLIFFVRAILSSQRHNLAPLGAGTLVGATGVARTELSPEGVVFVNGERWQGVATGAAVPEGARVVVREVQGMKVRVTRGDGEDLRAADR